MGISGGPNIIEDGLVLALDAADVFLPVNKNLLTYTNDLSNAAWGKIRSQITASATTAPDGTNTAFAMTITDATGLVRLSQSPISASIVGGPYTFSVYLKQNNISASLFDTGIYNTSTTSGSEPSYNILNNFAATGSSGGYVSNRTVTSVGNGWYRVATTATIANNSSWYLFFDIEAGSGTKTNGQSLYLWGPQFEYGTIATEYQPVNVTTRIWPNLVNQSISGSLLNNPAFDPSNGGSIVFDGVNDYVGVSNTNLKPTSGITQECWLKAAAQVQVFIGLQYGISSNNSYALWWGEGGTNTWNGGINIGGILYVISATTTWPNSNTWFHFVHTYDGSTQKLYYNGNLIGSENRSGTITYDSSNTVTTIGCDFNGSGYNTGIVVPTNGNIPIAKIYNRGLTSSEIQQNYNAQKSRFNLT
jgi:hypothetical protein